MTTLLPPSDKIAEAKSPRPCGYIESWNPRGATLKLLDDVAAAMAVFNEADVLPVSGRQIFYRMTKTGYGKDLRAYKRLMGHLQTARRSGRLDWATMRDDGVKRSYPPGYVDADEARNHIEAILAHGTINKMTFQPVWQWVMCESAGMLPQLAKVADRYGAVVMSKGGFDSVEQKRSFALEIVANAKPALIWHVGDYDPSGTHVYQSAMEDVVAFAVAHGHTAGISFQRLAVTPEQIEEYDLPMAPTKTTDARSFDGRGTVQAEALDPLDLRRILTDAMSGCYDLDADAAASARSNEVAAQLRSDFGFDQ